MPASSSSPSTKMETAQVPPFRHGDGLHGSTGPMPPPVPPAPAACAPVEAAPK